MNIKSIEYMLMRSFPALKQEVYDGWILRYSNGYTKRANSISPYYESFFELEEKFEYCENYFRRKGLEVTYKLLEDNNCLEIDRELEKRGYERGEEVSVQEASLEGVKFVMTDLHMESEFSEYWFEFFVRERNLNELEADTLREILKKNDDKNFYVFKKDEDRIIAGGLGVIEEDRLGIYNIYVCPTARGKGYGKEVVKRIMVEGRRRNIDYAYLQVEKTNLNAINLYSKLGFKEIYKYWYRIKK